MCDKLIKTDRSRVRRSHKNANYDRRDAYDLLDAQPLCSVGYIIDGRPYVTPTLQWRSGNRVLWHGSSASKALRAGTSTEVCLTVSVSDGFVMARSGFNHSVNSRSLTLFGQATPLDLEEKTCELDNFIDKLWPGRTTYLRPTRSQELKATLVLAMEIAEGSMKVRTGPPQDEEEDYELPIWAGVIPLNTTLGKPLPDPRNLPNVEMPDHIQNFILPDQNIILSE